MASIRCEVTVAGEDQMIRLSIIEKFQEAFERIMVAHNYKNEKASFTANDGGDTAETDTK